MKIVLALLSLLAAPAFSQPDVVFETEYDVVLTVGESQYRSQSTARVENNQVIPIEFPKYKVELKMSLWDASKYIVETSILESVDGTWVKIDVDDSGGFGGSIGSFNSFSWNGDGIGLNIGFSISIAPE